jgi:hypothetical protein
MESAKAAPEIWEHSRSLGHVPIIDANPRREGKEAIETENLARKTANYALAEAIRYNQRSSSERVNSNLKDNCCGKQVRVRRADKVFCHLMFGILVITVEQIMRLVT